MSLDDDIKIVSCGISGMLLGELAFLAVNGSQAFIAGRWMDCVKEAHEYHNPLLYVIGGVAAGVSFGMWYYNRGPWSIPPFKPKNKRNEEGNN